MVKAQATKDLNSIKNITDIADNTAQHFWFNGTGVDTGAHITEVPQEEWSDSTSGNYHKGSNLLARSNGLAIRNGMTELAKFAASGVQIGADADYHGLFTSSALEFYDASGNKQMALTDNAANYYKDGVFKCSIGERSGFYGIRLGGTNYTPERGDNSFECIGQLTEDDYGYYSMGKVRAESGGEYMLQKEYSRASLALEAYAAYGRKYNYLRLQAYTSGWSGIEASVAITVNSDERLKENFEAVGPVSDLVLSITPIVYSWKDKRTDQRHIGFKAQEVQAALANYVDDVNEYALVSGSSDEYLSLSYTELIPLIIDQLQKQKADIDELKGRLQ